MKWSKYQLDIFEAFEHSQDSLLIEAVAGSGKSTTLLELARIMERAFPSQRAVFVAFNKSIADNLAAKLATVRNVRAMTLHSAGFAAWRRAGGLDWSPRVQSDKVSRIMRETMTWEESRKWGETTRKLVGLAKQAGIVPYYTFQHGEFLPSHPEYAGLVEDTLDVWEALMDPYSLDPEECNLELVRRVLARSIETARETIDYDDMLYMPVIAGVPFDRYDVVLVDEAQDLSGIQHEIVSRMAGRVISVGDKKQSIYGFRGAHHNSMDLLQERFGMRELPLSVCYRCPQAVVDWARQWCPQIEAAEGAAWGYVGEEGTDWAGQAALSSAPSIGERCTRCGCEYTEDMKEYCKDCRCGCYPACTYPSSISKWRGLQDFHPGDAILCRLTRPLVEAAFALIRARVVCRVLGRDIGKGLVALALKVARKRAELPLGEFWEALDEYQSVQTRKWNAKGEYAKAGMLADQCDTLRVWWDGDDLGPEDTVASLCKAVENLFTDNGNGGMVTLSTIHKFKGMEACRVFVLDASETMPCKWAKKAWELEQEGNLAYVAATRAMHELRYITTEDLRRSHGSA